MIIENFRRDKYFGRSADRSIGHRPTNRQAAAAIVL
jgi:hypothetical protein